MLDTFTAYAPDGFDTDADGMRTPKYATRGTTRGKLQSRSRQGGDGVREVSVGNVDLEVFEGGLHLPLSSPAPVVGDLGTAWEYVLTTLGPATPPELLGSRWLVVGSASMKSYVTARRLDVVRLS